MLENEKQVAAQAALRWVRSGMTVGLGSGTTAGYFIRLVGQQVRSGRLSIEAVASSRESATAARDAGISVIEPRRGLRLDLTVDGADEISPQLGLVKGRGGALLREKALAQSSKYFLVIADSSKRVPRVGRGPIPVEVIPFTLPWTMDRIEALGGQAAVRLSGDSGEPYRTDQQNYILDCRFEALEDPALLAQRLKEVAGIVEHGLFLHSTHAALIAEGEEALVFLPGRGPLRLADFSMPW